MNPAIEPRAIGSSLKVLPLYATLPEAKSPGQLIRVSVVDDDRGVRQSIGGYINGSPGFKCLSCHATAESALEHLPAERPDVVLMDIHLTGMDGIECTQRLKASAPEIQIMMLTGMEDADLVFRALSAGATGYILKRTTAEKLLQAITDVHLGGSPMTSSIARQVVASFRKAPVADAAPSNHHLTAREQSILEGLAKGLTYQQIASHLAISMGTLRTHIRRIYDKLRVHARTEAVAKFVGR